MHPEIQRFGKLVLDNAQSANRLSLRCASWLEAGGLPDEALDDYSEVQAMAGNLHKEVECLDSIDLSALRPSWGDKATVRMSRKTLIGFAERIMSCLEGLQSRMAGHMAALKERRRAKAARQQQTPAEELSLEEKYGKRLRRPDSSGDVAPEAAPPVAGAEPEPPAAKRQRAVSAEEVAELLERLRAKTGQPLQLRPVQAFRRQLANLAALPDFVGSPQLCREGVESVLSAVNAALDARPSSEAVASLLLALQRIESLQHPSGLPSVLSDLAQALEGL
uniref:Uncharacterized protein n=1 Tax=Alexandrium catenella TaxID=2925 RepID=A0A7S1ML56_ALECA